MNQPSQSKIKRDAEQAEFEQEFNGGLKLPPVEGVSTLSDAVKRSEDAAVEPSKDKLAAPMDTAKVDDKDGNKGAADEDLKDKK